MEDLSKKGTPELRWTRTSKSCKLRLRNFKTISTTLKLNIKMSKSRVRVKLWLRGKRLTEFKRSSTTLSPLFTLSKDGSKFHSFRSPLITKMPFLSLKKSSR